LGRGATLGYVKRSFWQISGKGRVASVVLTVVLNLLAR
jgi:hypothetical protein